MGAVSADLFQEILQAAHYLCRNEFGKHVLISLLQHGTDEHRSRVVEALLPNLASHATHRAASYVVQRSLEFSGAAQQDALAAVLLRGQDAMLMLGRSQAGCHVV